MTKVKSCWGDLNLFVGIRLVIVPCILVILATGCAKLQHMDQLLTLKGLSDEQTRMGREIERQDARFERLVAAVEDGSIGKYKTQKSVSAKFGPPVFTDKTGEDGRTIEVWVYRYAAQFFDSPKVYLYWDETGHLIRWNYVPAPPKDEESSGQNRPAADLPQAL